MVAPAASNPESSVLALLGPQYLAMLERGMPTLVASCDDRLRPSVSLAIGCTLDILAGEMTVFVSRRSAPQLLDDIASHGRIAVMCTEPISHRAVQLKSGVVRSRSVDASDEPALARFMASFENELLQVGHSREFSRCIVSHRTSDAVALTFAPDQAFNQMPGPQAGVAFSGGRSQ